MRPNKEVEMIFKYGTPGPKELPAHIHSDLLSFDLFKNGKPFLVSCGTSIYENSKERLFERSSPAHNVFQLGKFKKNSFEKVEWIEPIEIWNSFRAGKKAKPLKCFSGVNHSGDLWLSASHDGYISYGALHERIIYLRETKKKELKLVLIDTVQSKRKLAWRQFWHLAPNQSQCFLDQVISNIRNQRNVSVEWTDTWYSNGFGLRIPRKSVCISGIVSSGFNVFRNELSL